MREIMSFTSAKDAMEWATIIAKSKFCPKEFFNHPESVLVAIAYGAELGLKPLQALQNICVINGKPSIYGDAMLAVCKNHPDFEWIKEEFTETNTAHCTVKRKNQPYAVYSFGKTDAEVAGLWNRPGPWKQYPKRMLQMRARSFALRDCFPDVLKGMIAVEEAQDYQVKNIRPEPNSITTITVEQFDLMSRLEQLIHNNKIDESTICKWLEKANVNHIGELPTEIMQKLITHLEQMETLNGQN